MRAGSGPLEVCSLMFLWRLELGSWGFESFCQPSKYSIRDCSWRNAPQAFKWLRVITPGRQTRLAGQRLLRHMLELAIRTSSPRLSGTKQSDHWFVERSGDVHRPGIVGDHHLAQAYPFDQFQQ